MPSRWCLGEGSDKGNSYLDCAPQVLGRVLSSCSCSANPAGRALQVPFTDANAEPRAQADGLHHPHTHPHPLLHSYRTRALAQDPDNAPQPPTWL